MYWFSASLALKSSRARPVSEAEQPAPRPRQRRARSLVRVAGRKGRVEEDEGEEQREPAAVRPRVAGDPAQRAGGEPVLGDAAVLPELADRASGSVDHGAPFDGKHY